MSTSMFHHYTKSGLVALLGLLMIAGCTPNQPASTAKPAAFWPPFPDEPRLQFLVSYARNTDVEPAKTTLDQLIAGGSPQQTLPINKPYGVKMWNGKIYVCDLSAGAVTILDLKTHRTLVMGKTGAGTLLRPVDIAIAADGTKYVADAGRNLISVFDAADHFVGSFGHKDFKPVGVAVYENELFVSDFAAQKVEVMDRRTGQVLRTIGEAGNDPGQFIRPLGLAVDEQGNLFVTDVMRCVIQKFDRQGKLQTSFGNISANVGGLVRPKHIAVDKEGIIYVVDAAFQNVQMFDQKGQVLTFFGGAGDFPGAMYLPAGICIHTGDLELFKDYIHPAFAAEQLVIVTNQFGDNKVSVYAMGKLRAGMTVNDISNSKGLVTLGATTQPTVGAGSPLPAGADGLKEPGESPTTAPAGIVGPPTGK